MHEPDLRSLPSGPRPGCGGGERAELLQDPQVVPVAADNVCNLALGNAQRRRPGPGHYLARRWHWSDRACPFPLVGACGGPDSGNHVILGKLIVDGDPVIGKSSAHLGRDIKSRRQQLRSKDVLPEVQLSLVVERLEVLANEGLVLRGGHGPASCQGSNGTCSPHPRFYPSHSLALGSARAHQPGPSAPGRGQTVPFEAGRQSFSCSGSPVRALVLVELALGPFVAANFEPTFPAGAEAVDGALPLRRRRSQNVRS